MALRGAGFMYDKLMKIKAAEEKRPVEFTDAEKAKEVAYQEIDYISDCLKILVDKFYEEYAEKSVKWKPIQPFFQSIESMISTMAYTLNFWFVDDEIEDKLDKLK